MTTSTDATLAYGYNLGDDPDFAGLDYGDHPSWLTSWDDEDDEGNFSDDAERRLLDAAGYTARWEAEAPGRYVDRDRIEAALAEIGVVIETHCSDEAPMYVLAAAGAVTTATRGTPETITGLTVPEGADERLAWAVETLGLDVGDAQPAWLLFSYWDGVQ